MLRRTHETAPNCVASSTRRGSERLCRSLHLLLSWPVRAERGTQECVGLGNRSTCCICFAKRVEHHEVMDDAFVPNSENIDAGGAQLGCVRLAFVAEDVCLAGDHERLRQSSQLLDRGPQR